MTRDQARAARAERDAFYERRRWIERARPWVDEAGFEAIEAKLRAKDPLYTPRDAWWAATNMGALAATKRKDWSKVSSAYWALARQLFDETRDGRMSTQVVTLRRNASKADMRYRLTSERDAAVDTGGCDCGPCSISREPVAARVELAAPRLPHVGCEAGWCSCWYTAV